MDTSKTSNGSADLLGLDTGKPEAKQTTNDDIFSSFFSAPQEKLAETPKPEVQTSDLKVEEENFFKQPAPTEKEKSKLTKDSILALYSQTPTTNLINQFSTVPQLQPQAFPFATSYQNPMHGNMPMQNGMQHFNQFQPMNSQFQQFGSQIQPHQTMQAPHSSFPQNNQQFFSNPPVQQPQQLTQQFGSLNLGQSFPNAFGQPNTNVASNSTWQ